MSLLLEIRAGHRTFAFDVLGALEPRLEPVWKEAVEPPEVTEIREVWEVRGARLVASDGDPATFWGEWTAFLDLLRARGPRFPVAVQLARVTGGARQVVWTLGPATHERFRIDQVAAGQDETLPRATWRVLASVTLVVSAVQRFADPNGIVGWDQETNSRHDAAGLHSLEWRTTLTTREGTNALDKARQFGRIDVRPFGPSYTYETNGPDGVEVTTADADEPNRRVPTRAVAVSRIRQWGVHVGTTGPGTSPGEVSYSVRTRLEKDDLTTTYRATARGPGALAWVERRAPGGAVHTSEVLHEESARYAEGTWTTKGDPTEAETSRWQLQVEISGGSPDIDFEPVCGGYEPVLFEGALLPWKLTVQVRVKRRGDAALPEQFLLPGVLPEPWILDRNASTERQPIVVEDAKEGAARLWQREASLVYLSPRRPAGSPLHQLEAARPVLSYYLDADRGVL